jgi:dipeptidyl aminopeptidase/acylaminoacyl peptidase
MPVLSPQSDRIAFVAHSGETKLLWVRSLSSETAQALDGTAGAAHPFWSPDGRSIGFLCRRQSNEDRRHRRPGRNSRRRPKFPRRKLERQRCDRVRSEFYRMRLLTKVSAQGGTPAPATVLDRSKHTTHRWPWFLPDGKHFIFPRYQPCRRRPQTERNLLRVHRQQGNAPGLATDSAAQYASGYLLYRASTALVAQPFDPQKGILSGSADSAGQQPPRRRRRVAQHFRRLPERTADLPAWQYRLGKEPRLVLFDRSGKTLADYDPQENITANVRALLGVRDVRLSPDNKRVAFASGNGIWTLDLGRKTKTRITFDEQVIQEPAWSPDGKTLIFTALVTSGGGNVEIRSKAADGSGAEQTACRAEQLPHTRAGRPTEISNLPLGRRREDGFPLDTAGERRRQAGGSRAAAFGAIQPLSYRVSPDSHWVAYASDESGQQEVYITTFPEGKGKWRVSANSGAFPAWSGNGRELFFKDLTDIYLRLHGDTEGIGGRSWRAPASVPRRFARNLGISFDVFADGKRVLVNHSEEEAQAPLQLITNWPAELKK